jgi:hypothetical protein
MAKWLLSGPTAVKDANIVIDHFFASLAVFRQISKP